MSNIIADTDKMEKERKKREKISELEKAIKKAEAEGTGIGYAGDITLKVKAYKKKDKSLRVTEIQVIHEDTDVIGGVCCTKLVDDIKARQRLDKIDMVAGATFSSEGFIEAFTAAIEDIKNQE